MGKPKPILKAAPPKVEKKPAKAPTKSLFPSSPEKTTPKKESTPSKSAFGGL